MTPIVTPTTLIITMIVGLLIPLITEILAKRHAPGWLKSLISLLLATTTGILTPLEEQPHVDWKSIVFSILTAFGTAAFMHYNAWLPFRVTGDAGLIQATIPIGIATPSTPPLTTGVPVRPATPSGQSGQIGLLVLALVLIVVFGGLGFAAHLLWLGLIVGVVLLIAHAITRPRA